MRIRQKLELLDLSSGCSVNKNDKEAVISDLKISGNKINIIKNDGSTKELILPTDIHINNVSMSNYVLTLKDNNGNTFNVDLNDFVTSSELNDVKKISAISIDTNKDWNGKSITNIPSIGSKPPLGQIGWELLNNELRFYDELGNVCKINKYDSDSPFEIFIEDKNGNEISESITLKKDSFYFGGRHLPTFNDGSLIIGRDTKLPRSQMNWFDDDYCSIVTYNSTPYVGATNIWGEIATLPYRFAVPTNGADIFTNVSTTTRISQGITTSIVEMDSLIDKDDGSGKKKYKTIKIKVPETKEYICSVSCSILLREATHNDWVGIGFDQCDTDHTPNGGGSHTNRCASINIAANKYTDTSNLTYIMQGSKVFTLDKDKDIYISIQSLYAGYIGHLEVEIKPYIKGSRK